MKQDTNPLFVQDVDESSSEYQKEGSHGQHVDIELSSDPVSAQHVGVAQVGMGGLMIDMKKDEASPPPPPAAEQNVPPPPLPPPKGYVGIFPPRQEEPESEYEDEVELADAWMAEAPVPPPSFECIHLKAMTETEENPRAAVLLAADISTGTLHVAFSEEIVEEKAFSEMDNLTRCVTDSSKLGFVTPDGEEWYYLADSRSRQCLYQALLTGNPYGADDEESLHTQPISVHLVQIDSTNEPPLAREELELEADVICALILGEDRDAFVDRIQDELDDTHEFTDNLYADAGDGNHCLVVFISHELMPSVSNEQCGTADYSSAVTFWIGETTFGIFGTEGGAYEDTHIGAPGLDLIQFRHVFAIGESVTDTIALPASELSSGSAGFSDCFVWRTQPEAPEGIATKTDDGESILGEFADFDVSVLLPQMQEPTEEDVPYMLLVDNLRASNLQYEGSPYVHIGGQFCEDRRSTAKMGSKNPVWKFDRHIGGHSQSTPEVLQIPTSIADPGYLEAQRVMIGVLDEESPSDPLIGFCFLPLAKFVQSEGSALDFTLDLFSGMEVCGTISGRLSVHPMQSTDNSDQPLAAKTKTITKTDAGDNRDVIEQYFRRYDLDESGTINHAEELQQLCTNLSVRMELPFSVGDIDNKVNSAGDMEENDWSMEEFIEWFSVEFGVEVN